jgi:hypothetical protein
MSAYLHVLWAFNAPPIRMSYNPMVALMLGAMETCEPSCLGVMDRFSFMLEAHGS